MSIEAERGLVTAPPLVVLTVWKKREGEETQCMELTIAEARELQAKIKHFLAHEDHDDPLRRLNQADNGDTTCQT